MLRILTTAAAAALVLLSAAPATATQVASPGGVWVNPHRTVAVHTGPCGAQLCGWVVWASADAQEDARDAGVTHLIGTTLLEDYRPDGPGRWKGIIYLPDKGRRVASVIETLSAQELQVKGCILGGLICRTQVWTRLPDVPHG